MCYILEKAKRQVTLRSDKFAEWIVCNSEWQTESGNKHSSDRTVTGMFAMVEGLCDECQPQSPPATGKMVPVM